MTGIPGVVLAENLLDHDLHRAGGRADPYPDLVTTPLPAGGNTVSPVATSWKSKEQLVNGFA